MSQEMSVEKGLADVTDTMTTNALLTSLKNVRRMARNALPDQPPDFSTFVSSPELIAQDVAAPRSELERIFYAHKGRLIHKWTHYFEIYEAHLSQYRNTTVRMLEIGVSQGGSLELWRAYLGSKATIFGVDIDEQCAGRVDAPNQVRIGSQDDPEFLKRVVAEMGGVDIVLDDGSHVAEHQIASYNALFPLLREGGLYMIEDLHTSYWRSFSGGYRRQGAGIEFIKDIVDDMHGWYHTHSARTPSKDQVGAVHMYDSIAVIEKRAQSRPRRTTSPV